MKPINKTKLPILGGLPLCIIFLFVSCGKPKSISEQRKDVKKLEGFFPKLETDKVRTFRYQDWCKCLDYKGGFYANTNHSNCVRSKKKAAPFTSKSEADLNLIWKHLKATKTNVYEISEIKYNGTSGDLSYGVFRIDQGFLRQRYIFHPSYTLPSDGGSDIRYTKINDDWYYVLEDWN